MTITTDLTQSSGNVFADLGLEQPEEKGIATPQADIDVINRRLIDVKKLEGVKS